LTYEGRAENLMKKLSIALLLGALVIAAILPAQASGATLRQRVAALEAKMSCLVKYPVWNPSDYAWYGPSSPDGSGYVVDETVAYGFSNVTALDYAYGVTRDAWVLGIRDTSRCRSRFATAANPVASRAVQAAEKFRLSRVAALR
jgi:hypothetical protein